MNLQRRPMVLSGLAALAAPGAMLAQQPAPGKVWRIGVLSESAPAEPMRGYLARYLSEVGYVEGRNLTMDIKYAQSKPDLLAALAAELLAAKPDLLIGLLNREIIALKKATATVPIIMMFAALPVELGLIASLARPGGNITGTSSTPPEMAGKMLQVLRETVPRMSRLASLFDPDYPGMAHYGRYGNQAVSLLGLRNTDLHVRSVADIDAAIAHMERDRPDAISVGSTGVLIDHVGKVIEFAARHKVPAMYSIRDSVMKGGLMTYTPDFPAMAQRNAWMIDKIFKGAKPSDIPVEEPARFELVLNMKTAKAMGLVIPPIVMLQATQVIE